MYSGIDAKTKHKIIALISALLPEAKIYLFGSRARGTHSQWSDIDLALDAGKPLEPQDIGEINDLMEALTTPYKISVVDIYRISELMKKAIEQDKIVWKA